jgi:2,3-bisphosphoglycerate-independent phosphoglycerate mutase
VGPFLTHACLAAPVKPRQPGLLVVFDGLAWGDPKHPCNAVALARTPTLDRLRATCPATELLNNGPAVGLPPGQMGNSEVGHLNIGAGRVVHQDFMRINNAIRDGTFGRHLQPAFDHVRRTGGRLHLMGLLGPGGVHAHESHMAAALRAAAAAGIRDVWVHPIGDGRDTPPTSARGYLATLEGQVKAAGVARVADFVGRYYAMDRDNRWERTEAAYRLYTQAAPAGPAHRPADAAAAVAEAGQAGETDEFVRPRAIAADGTVRSGDAVVWLNFRPDRSRQMTRAFMDPDFQGFRRDKVEDLAWVCMTQYDKSFAGWPGLHVAFPPVAVEDCLAEHLSKLGLTQFHVAETEKYAHVTYFLNGGREAPFAGEDRHLVPSPKVATYDLQPEMSAGEVTDKLLWAMGSGGYDFCVVNFANPDMVGHTGKLDATVRAVEFVDNCLDRVVSVATELGFVTLITADHGNAEEMCKIRADGSKGEPVTKHTMNPSPLLVVNGPKGLRLRDGGSLENVSPTLLDLMGLPIPPAMTAKSLAVRDPPGAR